MWKTKLRKKINNEVKRTWVNESLLLVSNGASVQHPLVVSKKMAEYWRLQGGIVLTQKEYSKIFKKQGE